MTSEALLACFASVEAGETDSALATAESIPVWTLLDALDYDRMVEFAERYAEFFQQWIPRVRTEERLAAANAVSGHYVTALVHLDDAYGISAALVSDGLRSAVREIDETLANFRVFADGPDAGVEASVVERFAEYRKILAAMDFSPH